MPFPRFQPIGAGCRLDHAREARVRDGAVVALEEVLDRDLPVRSDLPVDAMVECERVDVDPTLGEHLWDLAEHLLERRCLAVQVDEPKLVPGGQADLQESEVLSFRELLRSRRGTQRAVERVRPGVIRALERLPRAGLLHEDRAAVAADVDERPLRARVVPDDDDGHASGPTRYDVVVSDDADVLPRAAKDGLALPL